MPPQLVPNHRKKNGIFNPDEMKNPKQWLKDKTKKKKA